MAEQVIEKVETGFLTKLQPWQSLFGLLMMAFGIYGLDERALIFYGMIMICLAFTMISSNKHKEVMKKVIIPFVVEQALKVLADYTKLEPIEKIVEKIVEVEKIIEVPVEVEKIVYIDRDKSDVNYTMDSNTTDATIE